MNKKRLAINFSCKFFYIEYDNESEPHDYYRRQVCCFARKVNKICD